MKKKMYALGLLASGMIVLHACNHPRTENEQDREPDDRVLSPYDGPAATTDTAHNDSIMQYDSTRIQSDPATPNF